ncbi:hypothetical protein CN223_26725 [Sinorhizobium meliloti]|uniref:Rap1a/Tai family immunity protein n=1 Tax=Rhizobium meliloti TaxID=382 RepID=UPI000FD9C094|nr:Rap1a/Tai family immunity protein [Sinorhizobium meliloti]MQX70106.1 hypothetical protein [Sinorhizobium meliloti]RVG73028.1 hypothetical protein CN223_26725 [Sinorhizobium meliloti]
MKKRIGLALLALAFTGSASSYAGTTQSLVKGCSLAKRVLAGDTDLSLEQHLFASYCLGFVEGYIGSWATQDAMLKRESKSGWPLCFRPSSSGEDETREVIYAFTRHVEQNPGAIHEPAAIVLGVALIEHFSCEN